jgi:hypothetical protein
MTIICDGCPESQVSQENFLSIQWAINGIVVKLPEEGFTHRLIDTGLKGLPIWYARMRKPGIGWLVKYQQ